jgi:hypothetical protein
MTLGPGAKSNVLHILPVTQGTAKYGSGGGGINNFQDIQQFPVSGQVGEVDPKGYN